MGFLQMLDRRRYILSLTDDGDELYEATGRKNVK
jgi:DNA-binding MarR family transcriptional regulator